MDQETRETLERMADVIRDQQAAIQGLAAKEMLHNFVINRLLVFSTIMQAKNDIDGAQMKRVIDGIRNYAADGADNLEEVDRLIESLHEAIGQ